MTLSKNMNQEVPPTKIDKVSGNSKKFTAEDIRKLEIGMKRAKLMAKFLDKYRVDAIVGFFGQWAGDIATATPTLYYLWLGKKMGLTKAEMMTIGLNTFKDFGIGAIPLAGDLIDAFYHSNLANVQILEDNFELIRKQAEAQFESEQPTVKATIDRQTLGTKAEVHNVDPEI